MTAQLSLWATGPLARKTDPATSHAAPPSAAVLTEMQSLVLEAHEAHPVTGLTDDELVRLLPLINDGSVRKRRCECVRAGLIVDSGERRPVAGTGRAAVVWRYVPDAER